MPSGPKKRRVATRKERLGIILDKEAKKSQDVIGIKSSTQSVGGDNLVEEATLPAAIADVIRGLEDESGKEDIEVAEQDSELEQKEREVNSFVSVVKNIPDEKSVIPTELKSNEAIQDTSFDESKKHFAEHVFTSDHGSILINKEEAVLNQSKDVDTGESIEDYDSNTRVENFVGHVHNAGFNDIILNPKEAKKSQEVTAGITTGSTLSDEKLIPMQPDKEKELHGIGLLSLDGTKCACAKDPKYSGSLGMQNNVSSDKEPCVDDKKVVEVKKNLKLISELIYQTKKIVEEELNEVNRIRDIYLKLQDDIAAIKIPQVI